MDDTRSGTTVDPREVHDLFPLADVTGIRAGFYVKEDGRADPVDVTMALAKGAKLAGVRIVEGVAATAVLTQRGALAGVQTTHGAIRCETVRPSPVMLGFVISTMMRGFAPTDHDIRGAPSPPPGGRAGGLSRPAGPRPRRVFRTGS